jgi:hypothetical protein
MFAENIELLIFSTPVRWRVLDMSGECDVSDNASGSHS